MALWPYVVVRVRALLGSGKPVGLEGINMLPSLVVPTFGFGGLLLAASDSATIASRLAERPRWSSKVDLQRREAELLCGWVQPALCREAEQYGVAVTADHAEAACVIRKLAGI